MKVLGLVLTVLLSSTGTTKKLQGKGTLLDRQGKTLAQYDVQMAQTDVAPGIRDQVITVQLPDGKSKEIHQRIEIDGSHFKIVGDHGVGGGLDLGDGVLTTYMPGPDGAGFAQTIMRDKDGGMRILRTELKNGEAVRFFRETYRPE